MATIRKSKGRMAKSLVTTNDVGDVKPMARSQQTCVLACLRLVRTMTDVAMRYVARDAARSTSKRRAAKAGR
jgi:hypothetical protein